MASAPQLTELDRMTGQISKRSKCGSLGEKVFKSEINFIGKPVAWCSKSDFLDNQMIYQYNNSISIQFHTVVSTEVSLPDGRAVEHTVFPSFYQFMISGSCFF